MLRLLTIMLVLLVPSMLTGQERTRDIVTFRWSPTIVRIVANSEYGVSLAVVSETLNDAMIAEPTAVLTWADTAGALLRANLKGAPDEMWKYETPPVGSLRAVRTVRNGQCKHDAKIDRAQHERWKAQMRGAGW